MTVLRFSNFAVVGIKNDEAGQRVIDRLVKALEESLFEKDISDFYFNWVEDGETDDEDDEE